MKVGHDLQDDIRRVRIAREVIGPDRKLMIDMTGEGRQGLLGRSGAKLYFQPSNGQGSFTGALKTVASAGWSDSIALASTSRHFRSNAGLLSVRRAGTVQYISAQGTRFAGIHALGEQYLAAEAVARGLVCKIAQPT